MTSNAFLDTVNLRSFRSASSKVPSSDVMNSSVSSISFSIVRETSRLSSAPPPDDIAQSAHSFPWPDEPNAIGFFPSEGRIIAKG